MRLTLALRRLFFPLLAALGFAGARGEVLRFEVRAPEVEGALYLAGDFNGWAPKDEAWRLERGEGEGAAWVLEVPRERLPGPVHELKLTRGSWDTVEVAADLRDRPNRRLVVAELGDALELEVAAFADQRPASWRAPEAASTVTGTLERFELESEALGRSVTLRVWLPPGYEAEGERRHPVLYMHDGQNVFDAATSFLGVEWGLDETLTTLIGAQKIRPWIAVGIENGGAARTAEYNPPYTSTRGRAHRGDAYVRFLVEELMPQVAARYRVAEGAANTALGGSSFGGNITLYAAMSRPERFGALLVESPSLGFHGDELLARCLAQEAWPERVFLAVGTRETEPPARAERYAARVRELAEGLRARGLGAERLRFVLDEGARHHESDWARRLPDALAFLLAPRE